MFSFEKTHKWLSNNFEFILNDKLSITPYLNICDLKTKLYIFNSFSDTGIGNWYGISSLRSSDREVIVTILF